MSPSFTRPQEIPATGPLIGTPASMSANVAPQIEVIVADKQMLWPPKHNMVPVQIFIGVNDACVAPDQLVVSCVASSNQPDDANGDGETVGDVDGQDGYSTTYRLT